MKRGSLYALSAAAAFLSAALVSAATPSSLPSGGGLQPFRATYSVVFRGMNAGTTEFQLEQQPDNRYLYSSRANARGMFRIFFSEEILQTTLFSITDSGVRPLRYRGDDGSDSTGRDITLDFDWDKARVTGVAEDKPVDIELPPKTQDAMSIQIAAIHELQQGRQPAHFKMVDKTQVKDYTYTHEGTAHLKTAIGELDVVIYRSQRTGSNKRVTRTWLAPSLGYIPVRAERLKEGKREWLMEIRALER